MFERKKSVPAADIPSIADLNPQLGAVRKQKADLGIERTALQAEDFELAHTNEPELADNNREARVAAILGARVRTAVPKRSTRRQEISVRLRDLDAASEILDREVQTETTRASALLAERLRPEYAQRVRALSDALIALDAAARSCRELSTSVADAGYSNSWMSAHFSTTLEGGRNGSIGRLLHEIARDGYLKPNEIPKELQ